MDKDNSQELNVFKHGYWTWRRPFENIRQFFRNIQYAWQRATKGYCDADLWNLDGFYGQLLINSLTEFNKKRHGYPGTITDEEWDKILNEIIHHLKEGMPDSHENCYWDELSLGLEDQGTGIYTPVSDEKYEKLRTLWMQEETRITELEAEEAKKGLELLGKWWHHLWD